MRNFLSVGNITQVVTFDSHGLTLVLGENNDTGAASSRNGAGKTTIINALSYALYGQALTNIKRDNLINKTNNKGMLVTLDFEINGNQYHIERGRRPGVIIWQVNNGIVNSPDTDESEGDSKWTNKEIERTVLLSHTLFKHIVALNTFTEPFLALRAGDQRSVIEELLGITQLSQKAEKLREKLKDNKNATQLAEATIKAKREANAAIQKSIDDIERKSMLFEREKEKRIVTLREHIERLEHVDIDAEVSAHKVIAEALEIQRAVDTLKKDNQRLTRSIGSLDGQIISLRTDLTKADDAKCPMCEQNLPSHKHVDITATLTKRLEQLETELNEQAVEYEQNSKMFEEAKTMLTNLGVIPSTFHDNIEQAYNHRNELDQYRNQLSEQVDKENPFAQQVVTLQSTGLQEINYDEINRLTIEREHQEFLLKLLTDKGSFIRKKIIDQNLSLLNHRLSGYLEKLGLPHEVKFQNDLSVDITQLGRDFDFDNLSRGERNRLILSLSWAFRDVFESMNHPINLMFIDELVDSGMDTQGVDASLAVIKDMSRNRSKNIFLISHREELISKCETILIVRKENGFTMIDYDVEL